MGSINLRALVIAILLLCCFITVPMCAESEAAPPKSDSTDKEHQKSDCRGCLYWNSGKNCCWYLIGEVGLGTLVLGYPEDKFGGGARVQFLADGGYMHRLTAKTDIGGTLYFAYDNESPRFGVKPRIRYRMGKNMALDFSPGILFPVMDGDGDGIGYVVSGSLSINSLIAVGIQYESYTPYAITANERTGIATIYMKFGSYVGTFAGILIVALGAIAGSS